MRVALVIPGFLNFDHRYRTRGFTSDKLGIGYLKAYLLSCGHKECKIFDGHSLRFTSNKDIVDNIRRFKPDVVGVSVTSGEEDEYESSVNIVNEIASKSPQLKPHICLGGYTSTFYANEILAKCEHVDSIVIGEGEHTFAALVRTLEDGNKLETVQGLIWRDARGQIVVNPLRPLIDDLDSLPFPHRGGQRDRSTVLLVSGSRGCYARCSFCAVSSFAERGEGRRWRGRSPENICDEIAQVKQAFEVYRIHFVDDQFFAPGRKGRERTRELIRQIKARNLNIRFSIDCRANDVDRMIFRDLREVGLEKVFVGIESGSNEMLKRLHKGTTTKTNAKAIETIRRLGIALSIGFIMFDPYTRMNEIRENLEFIRVNRLYRLPSAVYNFFIKEGVFKGTPIYHRLRKENNLADLPDRMYFNYEILDEHVRVLHSLATIIGERIMNRYIAVNHGLRNHEDSLSYFSKVDRGKITTSERRNLVRYMNNLGAIAYRTFTLLYHTIASDGTGKAVQSKALKEVDRIIEKYDKSLLGFILTDQHMPQ